MGLLSSKESQAQDLQHTLDSEVLPKIGELERLFKSKIEQFDHKIGQLQQSQSLSHNNRLDILIQSFDKNNQRLQDIQNNLNKRRNKTTQNIQQVITQPFCTEPKAQQYLSQDRRVPAVPQEESLLVSQSCLAIGNSEVLRHMRLNNELFIETIQVLQRNLDIKMDEHSQLIMDSYRQNLAHTSRILELLQATPPSVPASPAPIPLQDLIDNQKDIISSKATSVRKRITKRKT